MPWFLTPHGPHFVVEPGTIDEYERRDYVVMTAQQVTDYYAGVATPDPPSFATEAEVPGIVAGAVSAGTGPVAEALRAASGTRGVVQFAHFVTGTLDAAGGTDYSDELNAALAALHALGGGTLAFPSGTFRFDDQIVLPNDAATPPKQGVLRLLGTGGHWSGRGTAPVGGTILDLRATATTGKIQTSGLGLLTLEHLTLRDTSGGNTPFLYTTNTTIHTDHVAFVGSKTGTACDQDAIVFGGTQNIEGQGGLDHGFQGYGTVISRCFFSGIRRGVYGRVFANAVTVRDNTWWTTCGHAGGGAIEVDGNPAALGGGPQDSGWLIEGNLIEVPNYAYGIVARNANRLQVIANQCYDKTATTVAAVWFDNAQFNLLIDGFNTPGMVGLKETGTSVGTTTRITAEQNVPARFPQPIHNYGPVRSISAGDGSGPRAVAGTGDQALLGSTKSVNPYPEAYVYTVASNQVTDGVINSGSFVVTSATANWTASHEGLPIAGTGIPSGTIIMSRDSATQVTLSKAATATATGVTLNFFSTTNGAVQEVGFGRRHIRTKGAIGAATVHANAGGGGTATVQGTDTAWTLTLTTGTTPAAGQQVAVAAGINWLNAAKVQLTPKNAAAAAQAANVFVNTTISATTLHGIAALPASTVHIWDITAVE